MSIHVHRNSFSGGEISPLMDARVDAEKYRSSCRVMRNFFPRVYGGAFRRPGTIHLGEARGIAAWTEQTQEHAANLLFGGDSAAPGVNDDAGDDFSVGSLWVRDVRTVYRATSVTSSSATWTLVSQQTDLYTAFRKPEASDDNTQGWAVGSIQWNRFTGRAWRCSAATTGAAVWDEISVRIGQGADAPATGTHNGSHGYANGSLFIRRQRTLYRCTSPTAGAATWATVSGTHTLDSTRAPLGADDDAEGFAVGSYWIESRSRRAWKLETLDTSGKIRLVPFTVSADERYMLELGSGYCRVWRADGTLLPDAFNSPFTEPLTLRTPYAEAELMDVQMTQLGGIAYFAHPSHPPQRLARSFDPSFGEDAVKFVWSQVAWSFPAFRDFNTGSITATPSAATGYGEITFNSGSHAPFVDTVNFSRYTGARIMLAQRRAASHVRLSITNTASLTSGTISVLGDYELYTYGAFTGTLTIQRQDASGAWQTVKSFQVTAETARNIVFRSATETATTLRLVFTREGGSTATATAYLEASDSRRIGYARILSGIYFDSGNPNPDVLVELPFDSTDATTDWALESWAEYSGYPRAVAFHEQRLWFGGTELQPNTIWGSRINDFENFARGSFDDDALAFTLAASEGSAIQSILSHEALVVFTQSEEWTVSTSEQTAITPRNVFVRRQSRFGSSYRQAFAANNNLVFIQRGGRKLREFRYGSSADGSSTDLTMLAEHVTKGGVLQTAFQSQPDPIIWVVTGGGELLALTFETDQAVVAWSRHQTRGTFESAAVLYGDTFGGDDLWVSVAREIDETTTRRIERLDNDFLAKFDEGQFTRLIFVDAAKLVELDPASDTVSGLDHLEGEVVQFLADGAAGSAIVDGGEITLPSPSSVVVAGLSYVSTLQPSKIELELQSGTAQSRKFLCKRVALNLWNTGQAEYADRPDAPDDQWFPALERALEPDLGDVPDPFTGIVDVNNLGAHGRSVDVTLRARGPLPANILAMIPKIEVTGS